MGTKPDYADKFYQARAAQTAARDHLFITLRRFLERHGDIGDAINAGIRAAGRSNPPADLKPLVRAYARSDYPASEDHPFGKLVAEERKPKKRKEKNIES